MIFNKARLREVTPEEWLILDRLFQSLAANRVYYVDAVARKFYLDPAVLLALLFCLNVDNLVSLNTAIFHCKDEHVAVTIGLPYDPYTCPICNKLVEVSSLRYDFAFELLGPVTL